MALEQLKVREIVKHAVSKSVDIPEFQREFVWEPEQVKRLAESLYRDYPVGSLLLWDSSEYWQAKTAQGTQASIWIVDGQQRITALCLLLGQKPYWWADAESWNKAMERYDVMVNLFPADDKDALEFALPNPVRRNDPHWISVRRVAAAETGEDLSGLAFDIVRSLKPDTDDISLLQKVFPRLQRLWQIRERDIPVIRIQHEVEDVAEIFARLNQAGTRVKEADVVLALVAVRNPGWIREKYLPFVNELAEYGWDLDAGVLVRTMTGIGRGRARLKEVPRDFWNPENLTGVWKETKQAISAVLLKHMREFGIVSDDLIPSTNSLIPLFVLHQKWNETLGYSFRKAFYWFLLANRDGRYSGSAITTLNEDVRTITEATDFDAALERLVKEIRVSPTFTSEEFLNRYDRAGQRFLQLILYLLLVNREARDWVDGTRIGYDKGDALVAAGFEPQWHHIYPRSLLVKAGYREDDIHALANITIMNQRTNVNKLANKEPWHYLRQFGVSEETLRGHVIPEPFAKAVSDEGYAKKQWSVERYADFVGQRAHLLAQEANGFLKSLRE